MGLLCYFSTLSISVLKTRYLQDVGGDKMTPEAKNFMKQLVDEEIRKMQVSDVSNAVRRYSSYFVCDFFFFFC